MPDRVGLRPRGNAVILIRHVPSPKGRLGSRFATFRLTFMATRVSAGARYSVRTPRRGRWSMPAASRLRAPTRGFLEIGTRAAVDADQDHAGQIRGIAARQDGSGIHQRPGSVTLHLDGTDGSSLTTISDGGTGTELIACFRRGTLIRTPAGERPVEELAIGDAVVTASGAARPGQPRPRPAPLGRREDRAAAIGRGGAAPVCRAARRPRGDDRLAQCRADRDGGRLARPAPARRAGGADCGMRRRAADRDRPGLPGAEQRFPP
jgi:hypothetical protein